MKIKNKIKKVIKGLLAAFLAGYIGLAPLAKAKAEEPTIDDLKIPGTEELAKGSVGLSGTFRLDGSDGGYNGSFYHKYAKNGLETTLLCIGSYENLDAGNKDQGLDGLFKLSYKGLGLETMFGSNTGKRFYRKHEITAQEERNTTQDKSMENQSTAGGLEYKGSDKQLMFQFATRPKNTSAHTRQTVNYVGQGIVIDSDVGQGLDIEENNSTIRFGFNYKDKAKAEIGGEILVNSYDQSTDINTNTTVISTVGPSSDTTTANTINGSSIKGNQTIGKLKGGLKRKDAYAYGQAAYCFADPSSAGAASFYGTVSNKFKKCLSSLSFGGDFYKKLTKWKLGLGAFYSANKPKAAFKELNKNIREGYDIRNSIVSTGPQKEILQRDLDDQFFASLGKGFGGSAALTFSENSKQPGLDLILGGAYGNLFGYATGHLDNLSKPYNSVSITAGYGKWSARYSHRNVSDISGKDVKKHTAEIKYNF